MATPRFAGAFNAFVPEATGQLIAYVRNPQAYKYNQYTQLVPMGTDVPIGIYYALHVDDVQRLPDLNESVWADGAEAPDPGRGDGIRFVPTEFQAIRKSFPFRIGWLTLRAGQKTGLNLMMAHTTLSRNKAQMDRTQRIITLLETSANWPSTNTATASSLNGLGPAGYWDLASADDSNGSFLAIKKTLDEAARRIHLKTNGAVGDFESQGPNGLKLVLSPGAAIRTSQTAEIHAYLRESPFALAQVRGKVAGQNALWGLPDQLYGWDIIVENAVRVNARPKADGSEESISSGGNKSFIKSDTSAIIASRPGGLDGEYGAPSFSTVQLYTYDGEMQLEVSDDVDNRRTKGRVIIHDREVLAAGNSGFLITSLFSS